MCVFSLKVGYITESLGNHYDVLDVLQLDVFVLAEKNSYWCSTALFFFQEIYGLVR